MQPGTYAFTATVDGRSGPGVAELRLDPTERLLFTGFDDWFSFSGTCAASGENFSGRIVFNVTKAAANPLPEALNAFVMDLQGTIKPSAFHAEGVGPAGMKFSMQATLKQSPGDAGDASVAR